MNKKIYFRVTLNVIVMMLVFALTDYYLDGAFKYLIIGISIYAIYLYNQKKILNMRKLKKINSKLIRAIVKDHYC